MIETHAIPAYWIFALVTGLFTAGALYLLVMRPATFTPIPFLGKITLLLAPIACLASAALFAQAAGRIQVSEARIDALQEQIAPQTEQSRDEPSAQHQLVCGLRHWQIRPESAARLNVGDRVLIAEPPLGTGVLRLARIARADEPDSMHAGG